ncbi:MAG: YciI family protein [Hyphomonadaceae bacterium]|nr:YciI family protein [Hyphomonadaceae bacterium]
MQFLVYTEDQDDGLPIRRANHDAHLAWLKSGDSLVSLLAAGPWLDGDGVIRGSLLIVEADARQTVEAWLAGDTCMSAGLPKAVTVNTFKWAIGAPG